MNYANLHMHSFYSDGNFTPLQLVSIGKALGYKALALTDHETDGGVHEFMAVCANEDIECLSGCEFYGFDFGHDFHIVALDYDTNAPIMRSFIKRLIEERTEYTRKSFEYGKSIGIIHDINWNDVLDNYNDSTWICIVQVRETMRKMGLIPGYSRGHELKKVFNAPEVKSFKPATPSASEVIKTIREAGGIAVLAHPEKWMDHVPALAEYGLNGIEISHPDISEQTSALAEEAAKIYNLYRSGGTDHTGALSGCGGKLAIPVLHGISEEDFLSIKERRLG